MKAGFLTLALIGLLSKAVAQPLTNLSGRVVDTRNKAVAGANISIKNSYDGATSDSSGAFQFSTTDTGTHLLTVSSLNYKTWETTVFFNGTPLVLKVVLKEAPNELTAVVITAGSFEASDQKKTTVLKPLDIVTTASANADVAAAMRTLPGTQQVGESAELFVRGGEGYETRQFIDGTTVANPFFGQAPNIASRGRFSPFLFKGTVFSTGGYSALYGQALSSALILESIDLPDETAASASLSPLFVGAQYQHLARNKRSSWGGSSGYTNIGPYIKMVPQRPEYFKAPEVIAGDANFRMKTSATGMLKFYGSYARQILGLRTRNVDSLSLSNAFSLTNTNVYLNLSYRERITSRLKLNAGASYSQDKNNILQQVQNEANKPAEGSLPWYVAVNNYLLKNRSRLLQIRGVLEYKLSGLSALRLGAEHWYSIDTTRFNAFGTTLRDHYTSAFSEADLYLNAKLALRAGLRAEHSSLLQVTNLAPRASIAYKMGPSHQISADYGIFYQKPLNQFLITNPRLPQMRSDHYILTYQSVRANKVFRTQLFHKEYRRLVKTWPDTTSRGDGYARGVEFFWRDKTTFKNFDYWITYSYLNTQRDHLNFPYALNPSFAANHTANLVVKRFFTKMNTQFNINYQFATGRPYYDLAFSSPNAEWQVRDAGRTRSYNNLSLSVNYLTNLARAFTVVVFSVNNVLNIRQVFGYNYSFDGSTKLAIVPPANQFFFFGVFLSWGVDRTQDAINNNL
jgi:hypothetical protein